MRKVFFSFHYENDVWRSSIVRNSDVTKNIDDSGFIDKAEWEKIEKTGEKAIRDWIDENMKGTSVTVVLIGTETSSRPWVRYEVKKSYEDGKGVVGVYIHNIGDSNGKTCIKGNTTFGELGKDDNGNPLYFHNLYNTYDWVNDNGYKNLNNWIEEAAKNAKR